MDHIGLHTMRIYGAPAIISTVDMYSGEYETMVMFDDGQEIESIKSYSREEAIKTHNMTMRKYNDLIYEGSIDKCLGAVNVGQFVKPIIIC